MRNTVITKAVKTAVKIPTVPNFLSTTMLQSIPIERFTDEDLADIAQTWKDELIALARERRKTKGLK
jgi:hypothetical protein